MQDERGFAILLVEHDIELVASFTTRSYLLDFGRMIASGTTAEVMASPEMRHAYLGDLEVPDMTAALEFRNVDAAYGAFRALFDVSITIEAGEAVALVGPNGAGKTTIATCRFRADRTERRARSTSTVSTSPASRRTSSPAPASRTLPRAARCSARSPSRRTSRCRSTGSAAGVA